MLEKDLWREVNKAEGEGVTIELTAPGSDYWLNEAWNRVFRPRLAQFADALVWIVTSQLQQAYLLLQSFGMIYERWDALNLHRNSIEAPGGLRNVIDVVVDAAREILEFYLEQKPARADSVIEMWISSQCRLLKRLAIYGVAKSAHWDAEKKLNWIISNDLLYASGLKHEVFLALENPYPGGSDASRAAVLAKAAGEAKEPGEGASPSADEIYNLLNWLHKSAPDCPLVREQFERIAAAHPEFGPRERPDLDVVIGHVGYLGPQSPITVEELLSETPKEQMDFLLSFKQSSPFGPGRDDLLLVVQAAVARSFEWGKALAQVLQAGGVWDSDLWKSVVGGWNSGNLTEPQWTEVLRFLGDDDRVLPSISYEAANLLKNVAEKAEYPIPTDCLWLSFEVSDKIWAALAGSREQPQEKSDDWLMVAINRPAGILGEFWLHLVSRLRAQAGAEWTEIPHKFKLLFTSIINDDSPNSELARVVLASHPHFLFSCDAAWTLQHIVPLFSVSANPRRAIQCWHGYLGWGRWLDSMLPNLLPLYEEFYGVVAAQPDRMQQQFCSHLAGIACFGSINPVRNGWLRRFLQSVDAKQRERWASDVWMMLGSMAESAKQSTWDNWMKEYWQNRIEGIPMPLSAAEAGAMMEWSLRLEPVFPDVVEKICGSTPPELKHSLLYFQIPETALPKRYPHSVAQLMLYLLRKSTAPIYDFDRVDDTFEQLVGGAVDARLLVEICDELAKVGHPGAARLRALIPRDAQHG